MNAPISRPPAYHADFLSERLTAALAEGPRGQTVLLAGHYAIFTAGGQARDFLDEPGAVAAGTDMVAFTRRTLDAGADALERVAASRLLVLVDDIQFVRPGLPDRGARERLAAALADDYLRRTPVLPPLHSRTLESRGIDPDRVERQSDARWIYSERALRHAAVERIRAQAQSHVNAGSRGGSARLERNDDGSRIIVRDPDHGEHTLVHSGHTSCAGGYLELVMQLRERGVRRLVTVVPPRCLGPVTVGAALARSIFGATEMDVINVPADVSATAPADRDATR